MVGPNLPFGGLACGLVLGPLPSQCIPRHPATILHGDPSTSEIVHRWLDFNVNLVQGVVLAADVATCVPAYLDWFWSISHPYNIQMVEDNRPPVITPDGRRQDGNDTISEHPAVVRTYYLLI